MPKKPWKPKSSYLILGEEYRVRLTRRGLPKNTIGYCLPDERLILIDPSLDDRQRRVTTLHELFHGVVAELPLESTSLSDDIEEILADAWSKFIDDNFELIPKK